MSKCAECGIERLRLNVTPDGRCLHCLYLKGRIGDLAGFGYATIAPPMRSPVEQQKKAVRVTFVTIWLMIAGCLAAAWYFL